MQNSSVLCIQVGWPGSILKQALLSYCGAVSGWLQGVV